MPERPISVSDSDNCDRSMTKGSVSISSHIIPPPHCLTCSRTDGGRAVYLAPASVSIDSTLSSGF